MAKFYVYEWFNINTNHVFYVGKGCNNRYKDITNRNKTFLQYAEKNQVDSRIVKYFEDEDEAFNYEKELTEKYRNIGQCECNLIDGGYGGYSKAWTLAFKEYWSEHNPMKDEKQRQRMRENNPMYNKEIAMKSGAAHKRAVIINNIQYDGLVDAAKAFNTTAETIGIWCKQGGSPKGDVCRYAGEEQKTYIYKHHSSRQVYIENNIFSSIREAAEAYNFSYTSFAKALKKTNNYKGYKCGYVNQQPSQ